LPNPFKYIDISSGRGYLWGSVRSQPNRQERGRIGDRSGLSRCQPQLLQLGELMVTHPALPRGRRWSTPQPLETQEVVHCVGRLAKACGCTKPLESRPTTSALLHCTLIPLQRISGVARCAVNPPRAKLESDSTGEGAMAVGSNTKRAPLRAQARGAEDGTGGGRITRWTAPLHALRRQEVVANYKCGLRLRSEEQRMGRRRRRFGGTTDSRRHGFPGYINLLPEVAVTELGRLWIMVFRLTHCAT